MDAAILPTTLVKQVLISPTLSDSALVGLAGMDLVDQYLQGHLTLTQTNELLALCGFKRLLTSIKEKHG